MGHTVLEREATNCYIACPERNVFSYIHTVCMCYFDPPSPSPFPLPIPFRFPFSWPDAVRSPCAATKTNKVGKAAGQLTTRSISYLHLCPDYDSSRKMPPDSWKLLKFSLELGFHVVAITYIHIQPHFMSVLIANVCVCVCGKCNFMAFHGETAIDGGGARSGGKSQRGAKGKKCKWKLTGVTWSLPSSGAQNQFDLISSWQPHHLVGGLSIQQMQLKIINETMWQEDIIRPSVGLL